MPHPKNDFGRVMLVRYGEVWLKSNPVRSKFERRLANNLAAVFPKGTRISVTPGRIWVHADCVPEELGRVFGVVSFSPAIACDKNIEEIKAAARSFTSKWKAGTFAIRAHRTDKSFPLDSKQIEIAVAEEINLPVNLSDPDHLLTIEIRDRAYVFERTIEGPGGMPLGSAGKVAAYLRDADDALAAWLVMRRGAVPMLIKPKPALRKLLERWAIGIKLVSVKSLGEAVKKKAVAVVDTRCEKVKCGGLVALNPLVGFSDSEKAELFDRMRE